MTENDRNIPGGAESQLSGMDAFMAAVARTKQVQQQSAPQAAAPVTAPPVQAAPVQAAPVSDLGGYTLSSFTAKNLTEKSLEAILSLYGMNIADIYDLAPGQEWMFTGGSVTSAFLTQSLYRAVVKIKPSTFRQNTDGVVAKHSNLRTAFAHTGLEKPYQVVLKNRQAEVRFYDISNLGPEQLDDKLQSVMLSDRRRGFDLENDPLLRIAVYKTAGEDTYAVLLSQPHINNDAVSANVLLKELFLDYAMGNVNFSVDQTEETSYADYMKFLDTVDKNEELAYWASLLKDAKEIRPLPGWFASKIEYDQSTKVYTFDAESTKKIRALSRKFKATQNCVIQATWGVMLGHIFDTEDAMFASISSGRSAEVKNINSITGGMVNAFPVLVRAKRDGLFADAVKDVQQQFANSLKYSHCSLQEIQRAAGRKTALFDHLLNFHNFAGNQQFYGGSSIPGITLLDGVGYDNLSTDLCVYFMMTAGGFQVNFTYNQNAFSKEKLDMLMDCFVKTLLKVCDSPEDVPVSELATELSQKLRFTQDDDSMQKMKLISGLTAVKAFSGLPPEALTELADYARIKSFARSDIVAYDMRALEKCYFVVKGQLLLQKRNIHGWYNLMSVISKGAMVSAAGVLDDCKNPYEVVVASQDAELIALSKQDMQALIGKYPQIALNIVREVDAQARKYATLWVAQDEGM